MHNFTKDVPAVNCTGGGRGTGMCHSGSQERRRGDSYLGAEFSQPPGFPPDAHVKAGLLCIDCHENGGKGMGDISRKVDCGGCHYTAWKANSEGPHRNLSCQACHISRLGGYQMTVWGKGTISGKPSPFVKYSLYYGVFSPPILIKNQGMYTPYKVWPNIATNFKGERLRLRGSNGAGRAERRRTHTPLWALIRRFRRRTRRLRGCSSRPSGTASVNPGHVSPAMNPRLKARGATWEYLGYEGSEPFTGAQKITADAKGLRITDIRQTSSLKPIGDAETWDYAAWKYMKDIWNVPGDFSIPRADAAKYSKYINELKYDEGKLKDDEARLTKLDKKSREYRELSAEIKKSRAKFYHNPEMR